TNAVERKDIHGIEMRLELIRIIGADAEDRRLSIYLTQEERERADEFIAAQGFEKDIILIGLHPGAQKPFKLWQADNFVIVGNALTERLGCRIIVTGSGSEKHLADSVASKIPGAVSIAGVMDIRETAAIIEKMALFITNDTGPMHIAFALRTPTLSLFSPTDPALCGPYHAERAVVIARQRTCSPCIGKGCVNPICMRQITADEVIMEAEALLGLSN
ncbi:MAG: glycosyltransferase family 9 protein, partial [Nitrospirae bacterium]|nr:glycosyltransferase family 9 protein [Nitrospirota bacterium]